MWICSRLLNVECAVVVPVLQWRVLSWVFGVVLWCLRVTSLQDYSPDIPKMAACTGKLFHVTYRSHPVYGRPDVSLELSTMTESADEQIPHWLSFNRTSRSLSGVPLSGDESTTRLAITAKCHDIFAHTAGCSGHSKQVFQLTVSRCSWPDNQVSWLSVASGGVQVATDVPSPEYGSSHVMFVDAGCEVDRVVASLVLCSTSEQLTSRDRLNLMLHLSDFLAIPVGSISLEPSSTRLLAAVNKGFHVVSAGPGSDDCNLNQNVEILWWLPCSTVKHLHDFIRVLQHNVDGGRMQQEIGRAIVGWYVASSSPLISRPSRRRRATGYRTAAPTPVLSPLKPTSLVGSAQVESTATSSTDLSRPTVPFTATYKIVFPESSSQIQTDASPPALVSSFVDLFPGYPAETTHLPSLSAPLSSLHVTSTFSLTSTPIITSQQLTQPSWTARLWDAHDTSRPQFTTDSTFSYLSAQQLSDRHLMSSRPTADLPDSFVRVPSDLTPTADLPASFVRVPSDLLSTPDLVTSFIRAPPELTYTPSLPTSHIPSDPSSTSHLPTSFILVPSDLPATSHLATSFARVPSYLTSISDLPDSFARIPSDLSLTSDLPASFARVPSDLSSTQTAQYSWAGVATTTSGRPVRQSPTDTVTSSMMPDIPQATLRPDISSLSRASSGTLPLSLASSGTLPLSLASSAALEHFTSGLFPADNATASSSLLYLSSASTDWLREYVTESPTSFIQDTFSFDYIQTARPPPHMSFPEATPIEDVWFRPSQMSDSFALLASVVTLHLTSAYLVISRDVEVVPPLFTSSESILAVDSSTDMFPSAPDATSVTPDADLRDKYHSSVYIKYIEPVWSTDIHEYSNVHTLPTKLCSDEQSQELDHGLPSRSSPVAELPTLLYSSLTQTSSQPGSILPLLPLYTSHSIASTSEIVADWELEGKSREITTSSMMAEWDLAHLGVLASIHSQVGDSSKTISTPSVSASDTTPSVYPAVDDDTVEQSTVGAEAIEDSTARPWPGTAGAAANTTTVATPVSSALLLTSAATKRPRTRTTTPVVTRARTTTATTTTTTKAITTKLRPSTTKRPTVRKPSTHKVRPTTHRPTHRPTQMTTERTTTEWSDEDELYPDHFNNRPYVQRPIKVIRADQGKLLEFSVPHDVFYDIEDGDTRHLSLSLELPSNQVLPDNFWLFIEPTPQVIKALALHEDMDVKNMTVALVARDKQGLAAADYITLQINDTPRTSFTHVFRMKFAVAFLQFMHSRRNITELLEKIGSFFGDHGARLMTVLEVRPGSFMMSWTNNSLTGATCQSDVIRHLYTQMVRRDGTVRQTFSRHIGRHLHLKEVQLQPWGSCLPAPATTTTTTTTPSTSTKSTTTLLVSEVKGHGFSVWAHVILPVLIAVLVFILIILIIIFWNRRRRQRQTTLNAEKEAISIDGNPVIFPNGCEPEDLSSKTVAPLVSPAADLPPNQNASAGSSQVKNNLNRDQERARKSRDNREQEWLNKDTQIHEQESDRDWSRNFHRKHTKDSSSGRRHRDPDRTSRVSASSTLSWDRPNNHYLEEEAGSRSSTLKSTKSVSSDKRHRKSPPPYWHYQTDPPPYRMPPPYLSNNTTQM